MGKILEIGRNYRIEWRFHEAGGGAATKAKIFMRRAGEAAGESGNSF